MVICWLIVALSMVCCLLLGVDCWLVFGLCCAVWDCGCFVNSVVLLNSLKFK